MRIRSFTLVTLLFVAGCSGEPPAPANPPAASQNNEQQTASPAPTPDTANNEKQVGGPATTQAEAAQTAKPVWKPFSPADGHYSVLYPAPVQVFPSDDPTVKNYGTALDDGHLFMTSESERPVPIADPVKGIAALHDAQVANNEELFDKELSLDGHVGRTFGYVDSDGDVWQLRVFVKENTVFQVYTMVPKRSYAEDDPLIAKFFDSFRIKSDEKGEGADEQSPEGKEK